MKTWRFLWQLIWFRRRLFGINCACITLLFALEMLPGLIARQFFNQIAAHSELDAGLWWLIALLLLSSAGRVVFLFGLAFTNMPFMLNSAALLQKNMLARILRLPGAQALIASPGEAISRFRDDVDG
ncbi:MAG TPA: ABC transporter ATP-binding protein, partial [Chloroflexota bacterium]|nr:ABC transporter ATP-binding protein [Chloroflexota bacterium]